MTDMIPMTLYDEKLFCNGAEQLLYKPWTLYSNFNDIYQDNVSLCLKYSGLVCYISKEAYDRYGNLLPDTFALYVPELFQQERESIRFMTAFTKLSEQQKLSLRIK